MKPGTLIKVKKDLPSHVRFAPFKNELIQNDERWELWQRPSGAILVVNALPCSKETTATATATATAMATSPVTVTVTATATATVTAMETAMARKEFEDTGEIQGHVFLFANGKLAWVSHYDLDEIKE